MSRLCETRSFQWFVESLLHDLPRFREVHNEYLTAHRRANHVKRSQYPVPNLMRVGEWVEAPFWLWKSGNRQRRRLFVRQRDKLEVRVEQQTVDFRSLREDGWKIRPRALTLTMFCRLFVADLFIHGIGGALYDELNDTIMYGYTNIKPAPFLVLSGTLRLPLKRSGAEQDCRLLEWMIRDLQQNPQRHLSADESEKVRELLEAKQKWIELRVATAEGRHRRWRELRSITQQLQPMIQDQLQVLRQRLSECREKLRECRSAQRRDTAFCLYPEEMLRDFFAEVTSLCQSAERSQ